MSLILSGDEANAPQELTDAEVNHLRRLLAWIRLEHQLCEEMMIGFIDGAQMAVECDPTLLPKAQAIVTERVAKVASVPAYIRQAVKMLTADGSRRSVMNFSQRAVEAAKRAIYNSDLSMPTVIIPEDADVIARNVLTAALTVDGVAVQGWQPIESAPKDGSFILAYNASHDEQMVVGWTQDAGLPEIFPTGCWTDAGSRNCAINYTVNANYFQLWQPLPQPPAASDQEERR